MLNFLDAIEKNGRPVADIAEGHISTASCILANISMRTGRPIVYDPAKRIVVVDTGHAGMWMGGMYDLRSASQSYMRSAGHLGWAFPAGIGAKAACPDRPVMVFTGDAGFWYHIAEVETAVRWKLNSITVVNNNGGGNQSKRGFDRAYGGEPTARSRELWTYNPMNFAKLAEDMGALGIRVERAADIAPAFKKALAAGRPVVIDVVSDIEELAPTAVS